MHAVTFLPTYIRVPADHSVASRPCNNGASTQLAQGPNFLGAPDSARLSAGRQPIRQGYSNGGPRSAIRTAKTFLAVYRTVAVSTLHLDSGPPDPRWLVANWKWTPAIQKLLSTPAIRQQTRPPDSLRLTGTRWAAFPCMRLLRARMPHGTVT
jgi:hypothetical protein